MPFAFRALDAARIAGYAWAMMQAPCSIPETPLAQAARRIAVESLPVEIYRHCVRSYLFARLIARRHGIAFDDELLYVAAVLHDAGLSPRHMSERYRFEVDGALAARALLRSHGVEPPREGIVWDAITLHDSDLACWKAPEVDLVNRGVGADFGSEIASLPANDVRAVLAYAPRENFVSVFLDAVAEVVRRKPWATGRCFVTDVAHRMVEGFSPPNFCDAVAHDPFTGEA